MRITRFPSITESQFHGCLAAFLDSLSGELNAAAGALRRLEGSGKGSAFAYEMTLDQHRYGALIVLDRWSTLLRAFGPHVHLAFLEGAGERIAAAETVLGRANQVMDAAERYDAETVAACMLAFQSVEASFAGERAASERYAKLGPMLPEDYRESRRIFLEDLAAR